MTATDVESARQIHALLPAVLRGSAVGVLLGALARLGSDERKSIEAFELAVAAGPD